MSGFTSPPEGPAGGSRAPRHDYYGPGPVSGDRPGVPAAPPSYASRGSRPPRKSPGRRAILLLCVGAVVGLLLVGISFVVDAVGEAGLQSADNTCEYNPPPPLPDGTPSPECNDNDRGQDIEDQALSAYNNDTALSNLLFAFGLTITAILGGVAAVLVLFRRMDRLESEGPNPPE